MVSAGGCHPLPPPQRPRDGNGPVVTNTGDTIWAHSVKVIRIDLSMCHHLEVVAIEVNTRGSSRPVQVEEPNLVAVLSHIGGDFRRRFECIHSPREAPGSYLPFDHVALARPSPSRGACLGRARANLRQRRLLGQTGRSTSPLLGKWVEPEALWCTIPSWRCTLPGRRNRPGYRRRAKGATRAEAVGLVQTPRQGVDRQGARPLEDISRGQETRVCVPCGRLSAVETLCHLGAERSPEQGR